MVKDSTTTASATTTDAAVTLIAASRDLAVCRHLRVVNKGGVDCFVSVDGGTTKLFCPGDQLVNHFYDLTVIESVLLYRVAGGTDATGVYAQVWG